MKSKKGSIDSNAMTNKHSSGKSSRHRRYSESALDLKSQEDPEEKKARLYKTEICRNWEEQNVCRYGEKCQYAHGKEELRFVKRHPRYKTTYCQTFENLGACPYGIRCTFLHESSPHNLQSSLDSLHMNNSTPTTESISLPSVLDTIPSTWTPTLQNYDVTSSPLPLMTSTLADKSINSPTSRLPRLSISSSSSSSSSILSVSSPTIFSPIIPQQNQHQHQQASRHLNFYQDYQPNQMDCLDDQQKQIVNWHRHHHHHLYQTYIENYSIAYPQQDQTIKSQRYQLLGSRSAHDLFTNGDGFHSALGVPLPSTLSQPPRSFFSRHHHSNISTCVSSSSTNFANHKDRLIN